MHVKEKKEFYGSARILPGGRVEYAAQDPTTVRSVVVRKDTDLEPVNYHASHTKTVEELINQVGAKGKPKLMIDLTATDPTACMTCLEWGIPFLGVTFNDYALNQLKLQLQRMMFQKMTTTGSKFYRADLHKLLTLDTGPHVKVASFWIYVFFLLFENLLDLNIEY
jgi:hypothetical protein